jgi:hypothetical protein
MPSQKNIIKQQTETVAFAEFQQHGILGISTE